VPTYQYACTECGHAFDQFQSFSEDSLTVCPVCQGRLRKVFNAVGVVFKGSGFYRTDSRVGSNGDEPARVKTGAAAESSSTNGAASTTGTSDSSGANGSGTSNGSDSSNGSGGSNGSARKVGPTKSDSTSAA
jgi:putative FmdB family regulatory protein